MSAWGLAVHERSRLIAVSSNRREVTVFVPAIAHDDDEIPEHSSAISFPEVSAWDESSHGPYYLRTVPKYVNVLQVAAHSNLLHLKSINLEDYHRLPPRKYS